MRYYHLSKDVHLEVFDDEATLFIADREVMLTINLAAANLFEMAIAELDRQPFTREDCVRLLLDRFDLSPHEARKEAVSLLSFGLRKRIILKGTDH